MRVSPPPTQPAKGFCSYVEVLRKRCPRSNIFEDEEPVNANMSDSIRRLRQGARIQRITTIVQEFRQNASWHLMEPTGGSFEKTSQMMDSCGDTVSSFNVIKPETKVLQGEKIDSTASNVAPEPKSWAGVLMSQPPPVQIEKKALVVIGKVRPANQQVDDNDSAVEIQDNSTNHTEELSSGAQCIIDNLPRYVSGSFRWLEFYCCSGESEDKSKQIEWIVGEFEPADEKMDCKHIKSLKDAAKDIAVDKVLLQKRPRVWVTVARTENENTELRGGADDDEEGDDDEAYFIASEEDERAHGATVEIGEIKDEDSVTDDDHLAIPAIGTPVRCTIGLYHDALCDMYQITIRAAVLEPGDAASADHSASAPQKTPRANPLQDVGGLLTDNEEAGANSLTQFMRNLSATSRGRPAPSLGSAVSPKTKVADPKANTDEIGLRGGGYEDLHYPSSGANIRSVSKVVKSPKRTPTTGPDRRAQDRTELDEAGAAEVLLGLAMGTQEDMEEITPVRRSAKMPSLLEEFCAAEELMLLSMPCHEADQEGIPARKSTIVPLWLAALECCTPPKHPGDVPPLYSVLVVQNNQVSYCRTTTNELELRGGAGNISPYWASLRTPGRHRSGSRANRTPGLTLSQALANRADNEAAAAETLVELGNPTQGNAEEVDSANRPRMMSTWLDGLESSTPTEEQPDTIQRAPTPPIDMKSHFDTIQEAAASAADMKFADAKKTTIAVTLQVLRDVLNPEAPMVPANAPRPRPLTQTQLKKKKSKRARIKKWARKVLRLDKGYEELGNDNAEAEPMLLPQLRGGSTAQRAKPSRSPLPHRKHSSFLGLGWVEVEPHPVSYPGSGPKPGIPTSPVPVTNLLEEEWEDTDWEDTDRESVPCPDPSPKPDTTTGSVPVKNQMASTEKDGEPDAVLYPGPNPDPYGPTGLIPVKHHLLEGSRDGEPDPVPYPGPNLDSDGPIGPVLVKHRKAPSSMDKDRHVVKRPCQGSSSLHLGCKDPSRLSLRGKKVSTSQPCLSKLELAGSIPWHMRKSLWLRRQVKIRPWHSMLHDEDLILPSIDVKKPGLKPVEKPPPLIAEAASLSAEAELVRPVHGQTLLNPNSCAQQRVELDAVQENLFRTLMEKEVAREVCGGGVACNGCQKRFKNTVKLLYHIGCSITGARANHLVRAAYKTGHLCPAVMSKLKLAAWPYNFISSSVTTNSSVDDAADWLKHDPLPNLPSITKGPSNDWKTVKSPATDTALSNYSSRGPLGFFDGKFVTFIYPSGFRSEHETGQLQADPSLMSLKPESVLIPLRLHRAQTAVHVATMNPNFDFHALVVGSSYPALPELKCEGCGDYFPSGGLLLRHLGWRNDGDKVMMVGELEYLCPAMLPEKAEENLTCNCCKLTYPNEVQLYRHLRGTPGALRRSWRFVADGAPMPLVWRNRVLTAKLRDEDRNVWEVPLAEFVDKIAIEGTAPSEPVRPIDSSYQLKLTPEVDSFIYQTPLPVAEAYSTSDETGDFSAHGRSRITSMEVSSTGSSDVECPDACEHEEQPWTQVVKKKNRQGPQQNAKRNAMTSLGSILEEEVRHKSTKCGSIFAKKEEHLRRHWGRKRRCSGAYRSEFVTHNGRECGVCSEVPENPAMLNERWVGKSSPEVRKTASIKAEMRADVYGGDVPLDRLTIQEAAFVEAEKNERNEKIQEWVMDLPEEQTTIELWNCESTKQLAIPMIRASHRESLEFPRAALEPSVTNGETTELTVSHSAMSMNKGLRMTFSNAADRVKFSFGNLHSDSTPNISLSDMPGAEIVSDGSEERPITPDRGDGHPLQTPIIKPKTKPKTRRRQMCCRTREFEGNGESQAAKSSTIEKISTPGTICFGEFMMGIEPRRSVRESAMEAEFPRQKR